MHMQSNAGLLKCFGKRGPRGLKNYFAGVGGRRERVHSIGWCAGKLLKYMNRCRT